MEAYQISERLENYWLQMGI